MPIIKYQMKRPVKIAQMFVCGNLHRFVYEPYEEDDNGKCILCGPRFGTLSQVVVWAAVNGRRIEDWEAYEFILEQERRMYDEWLRDFTVELAESLIEAAPKMIAFYEK